jgi:PmbA protein
MLNKIITSLKKLDRLSGYIITETMVEANELFFIRKNVEMDRAKRVHHYTVTVYVDFEEDGIQYKGSSTVKLHPTMSEAELDQAIGTAVFAAGFVKNPYYPLAKAPVFFRKTEPGSFSKEGLPQYINRLTEAIYKNDKYEKGGINSCEIFLNRVYTRIVNSEGVDTDAEAYHCMVEFITNWKEEDEDTELYKHLDFSEFEPDLLTEEVDEMLTICKEKAIAQKTVSLGKTAVLLTRDAVKDFFSYYCSKSNASSVYNHSSIWNIGDQIQGEDVRGDKITLKLDPFMKNSTYTGSFDEDGYPLQPVTIIDKGKLMRYIANLRYAHYLGVEPTGSIRNMVVNGGSKTIKELKQEPYFEVAAFSDFSMDSITGDFGGEIRLAWYFDGEKTIPVTGGAVTGNINELHHEIYLSKELQKDNYFEGPAALKIMNMFVSGME